MAEELRVNRAIASGFVETRRSPETPLEGLNRALNRGGRFIASGLNFAARQAEKELREADKLLSSPLITEEEVAEIEENATYPLAKFRAANRRGELLVQREAERLQDEVDNTPDPLAARALLQKEQAALLETVDDPAVAAGIRERMASLAPTLLSQASRRRIETRNAQEALTVDETLRLALEKEGALGYVGNLIPMMREEESSGGDVDALLGRAAGVLEAHWLSGDDEDPNDNVFADSTMEAIDQLMEDGTLDSKQRKAFAALRQRIENDEEATRRRLAGSGASVEKQTHLRQQTAILDWKRDNPDTPVPQNLRDSYLRTAPTPAAQRAAQKWLEQNVVTEGVLHKNEWQNGEKRVKAVFNLQARGIGDSSVDLSLNPVLMEHALNVYREIGASLPTELEGEELRVAAQKAVADSIASSERVTTLQAENNTKRENLLKRRAELKKRFAEGLPGVQTSKAGEQAKLASIDAEIRKLAGAAVRQVAEEWRLSNGYGPYDLDLPLE